MADGWLQESDSILSLCLNHSEIKLKDEGKSNAERKMDLSIHALDVSFA